MNTAVPQTLELAEPMEGLVTPGLQPRLQQFAGRLTCLYLEHGGREADKPEPATVHLLRHLRDVEQLRVSLWVLV